jgi:hypothetical protein
MIRVIEGLEPIGYSGAVAINSEFISSVDEHEKYCYVHMSNGSEYIFKGTLEEFKEKSGLAEQELYMKRQEEFWRASSKAALKQVNELAGSAYARFNRPEMEVWK